MGTSVDISQISSGFSDPVLQSQAVFRSVMDAMSYPGRIMTVDALKNAPSPIHPAAGAVCLTLMDFTTPVWTDCLHRQSVMDWLTFYCGAPMAAGPETAMFGLITDPWAMPPLDAFPGGSDDRPDLSATLIIQVDAITTQKGRRINGPGIRGEKRLHIEGLPDDFWEYHHAINARYPKGLDLILTAGQTLTALPRTTVVKEDPICMLQ